MTKLTYFLLAAIVVALGVVVIFVIYKPNSQIANVLDFTNKVSPTPALPEDIPPGIVRAPSPVLILPSGKQEYLVKGSDNASANITRIVMDPLDPQKGDTQQITVEVNADSPVDSIDVEFESDNGKTVIPFALYSGTNQKGFWIAKWKVTDTTDNTYNLIFHTKSGNKDNILDFPVR